MSLYDEMETLRNGTKKTSLFDEMENRRNGIDTKGEVNASPSLSIKEPGIDYAALKNNADFGKYSSYDYKGKFTDVLTQPFVKELNLANAARNAKNGQINSTFSPEELKPYLHMTDEQYATMNYLANNPNYGARASYDYLRSLSQDLNKAAADVDIQKAEDFAEAHPVLGTIASVGANLSAGVHALDADATKAVRDFAYGYNPSLDVYDQGHRASYVSDAMTEKVTEGIDSNVGKFLYGTGTSMLNSAAQMALFGPFSTVIMGTNAFASRERELKDMGASDSQAFIGGALSGAIEYLTEKVSVEHFLKAKNFNSFGTWMKETLKQMFAEGSEEFFSDVLNTAVDHLAYAMGGVSDYENWKKQYAANGGDEQTMFANYAWSKAKDIGLSFLGGAISGGVMGNVSNAMNYGKQLKTGSNIIKSGRVQDLMDQAAMSGHEDFARLLENPTKTNVGYVQNELLREASEKANAKKASAEDKAKFTEKIVDYVTNQTSKTGVADKEGNAVHIESLSLEGDEIVINAEEGKFKLNEVDKTEAIQTALESTDGLNENAKKAFIENYEPGENLKAYSDRFDLVYTYGLTDNMEGMEKFLSETTMESENAMRIFEAGMRDKGAYTAIKEEQMKQRAILKETFGNVAKSGKMDASIISFDGDVQGKVNFEKLGDNKKSQFMAVSAIKDKLGLNITWFNSEGRKRGDKFYSNGFYDPSNNTIYLDINATNSGNKNNTGAIITALSHELVHWAEAKSPELYSKLRAKILDTQLRANEGLTRGMLIEGIRSAEEYSGLSDKEAIDEVMARSLENALSNTQLMEEITSDMTMVEKADFWTKVKNFFKDLANSLKSLLKRFDSQSTYAKLIEKNIDTYNDIVKMYDQLLRDASKVTAAVDEGLKENSVSKSVKESSKDIKKQNSEYNEEKARFAKELDAWLSTKPKNGTKFFEMGATSQVLHSIGVPNYKIKISQAKILDVLKKHKEVDKEIIKKIPDLLENPIIVLQSYSEEDSIVVLGELYSKSKSPIPVMVSLKVVSETNSGEIEDFGTVTSSYARPLEQYQNFLNRDKIYYINPDIKKTHKWLSAFRLQLPSPIHHFGSIAKIPQLSKYVKGIDEKYNKLARNGNVKEAQSLVEKRAVEWGAVLDENGNPLELYHGSNGFGRTVFDQGRFFTTPQSEIAQGYGKTGFAEPRELSKVYTPDDGTDETLIKNAGNVLGEKYKKMPENYVSKVIDNIKIKADELSNRVNDVWTSEAVDVLYDIWSKNHEGYEDEWFDNAISYLLVAPGDISEIFSYGGDYSGDEGYIRRDFENFNKYKEDFRDFLREHSQEINGTKAEGLRKFILGYELSDFIIDVEYKLYPALYKSNEYLVNKANNSLANKETLRSRIEQYKNIGAYKLYGNLGNKPLYVDGKGATWVDLIVPEMGDGKRHTTDSVAEWAKANGFTSVVVKNYWDSAMNDYSTNILGDAYIFFDAEQVKSADPITYDDNGEIIPLSQRFNPDNPDIRYSAKDSEGKNLTENQADYFKDSAIRDKDGKLKVMYHGTDADFTVFNPFISGGKNGIAEGYGLYFSDSPDVSDKYGSKVMKGYLNIKNPASKFERKISKTSLAKLIKATCEKEAKVMLEDGYESVSDAVKDTWISNYVNTYEIPIADAYRQVASEIMQRNENDFDAIQEVMSGMGIRSYDQAYDFYDTLTETIGVDGFVTEWTDANTDEKAEIALAFNSNQFKNVDNLNPTSDPDIRYSYKDDEGYVHLEAGEELSLEEITSYLAENASNIAVREEYSKLKKQVESIAKGEIKEAKDLSKYADSLLKDNGSKYDKSKLVEMLVEIQKNAKEGKNIERDCKSLAHFILANSSRMTVDKSLEKDLRNIREELRGYKLKLSENQKKEMRYTFGAEWTTVLLGKVKLSNTEGITLDEMWSTLSSEYPFLLEADVTDADQGVRLADLVKYLYSDKSYMFKWGESEERERTEALGKEIAHQLTVNSNKEVKEQRDPIEAKAQYDKAVLDYIADQREKFAKLKEQYNERTVKRNLRERIINKATRMNEKLVKNDKDNHIPEVLKQPLLNVLNALQLQNHGNESIARKFTNLADALEEVMTTSQAEENLNGYFDSNSYFVQNIRMIVSELNANMDNFSNKLNGEKSFKLMDLSVDGLRAFNDVLTAINRAAYNYDQALSGDTKLRISERGAATRAYLKSIGEKKTDKNEKIAWIKGFLNWDNVTQIYAFDRFGEGGKTTFKGIMEGQDKLALNTKQIVDYCNDTFSGQEYYDWSNENHEVEIGGHKYDVTTTQLMSLYALYKRKSSHQHLFTTTNAEGDVIEGQGIVLVSNEKTDSKYYQVRTTEADIKSLIGLLTDRQKAVADKLQNFMNTVCSDWGNYVTMKRFGILQFGEENYFPMQVFGDNKMTELRDKPEGASLYSLLNQSFTKSLNNKANGALELHDFFSVFLSHANGMATYNAMGLPVLDVLKWMNYTEDNYGVKESVQTWIRDAYGTRATSWLKQYLVDINGNKGSRTDIERGLSKAITNYKTAAVAANLRVALMQPTAYIKASIYIDPKYLAKAFSANPKTLKAYIAEMNEKAPLGLWKTELGMFDLNIGRSTAAKALQTDKVNTGKFKDKANAIREKAMDLFMKPAEIGDSITWGALYHACKLEIMDTQHLEGAELDKAVNEKFRETCFRTQVFDSINARSQVMRNTDQWHKLISAFASEPTLSYSMLSNEAFMYAMEARTDKAKAWKNHGKKIGKTALAWALCELAVSMVAGIPDFIRDDDETEDIGDVIKTYFKKVFGNYASDLVMLPWLRDAQGIILDGFDPSRPDEEIFNDLATLFNMAKRKAEGKDVSEYRVVYNVTKFISHLTGIPLSNVVRGAKSIINKTIVEWMGWDKIE